MTRDGVREVIRAVQGLGFKGGLAAPATRKRGRDFVDWLAISSARNSGVTSLHVNLGVRWLPLHKVHRAAVGRTRVQPECFEPLYVLMPHRDAMHWTLDTDDSNLTTVIEDLVDAVNGEAEEYWSSVSEASRVCQDLQRQSANNDFPSGLDWPLALLLTEGRQRALQVVEVQKGQLVNENQSAWLTHTRADMAAIEAYIASSSRGATVGTAEPVESATRLQKARDHQRVNEAGVKSEAPIELVAQLQTAGDPLRVVEAEQQLERAAVDGQRLLPEAAEVVSLLAADLPRATSSGVEASWRVLAVIAKASYWIAVSDFQVLLPVREAFVSDVVPLALELAGGDEDGAHVWRAVDVLLDVLSYVEDDPRPFKKALKKFSKRGPAEARYLSDIFAPKLH